MASTLVSGGELSLASDKPAFFFTMLELAEADVRFEKTHTERYLQGLDGPVKSRFQLFWERKGITPLRFVLRRR
jgi:tRNA G46 methylase TrmB